MSKSDVYEDAFLRMTFEGKAISSMSATGGTTALWVGLNTADPGDAGSTATEGGYTAYLRVQTMRSTSTAGWTVTSGTSAAVASVSPVNAITFAQVATTSTGTFSHAVVYPSSAAVGASALYVGTITPTINFSQNVTPQLTTGSSITEE